MQDIRKPYNRSKSNLNLSKKVEEFERSSYDENDIENEEQPVYIPSKSFKSRRNIDNMEMYPRRTSDEIRGAGDGPDIFYRKSKGSNSKGTWLFIAVVVLLCIGAGALTYVFNSATITITPKYQDIENFNKVIVFTKDISDGSSVSFVIATTTLNKEKTLSLSENKKVESKASGKIIVYNNFDGEPQKLIKNTRFESSKGKIYRINQSITIPGKKGDLPGSVEVTIYADSYGEEYNISLSDFTIPGFKGTPRYNSFYGRSKGEIAGGAQGNTSVASLSDINSAKDELEIELGEEIKAFLKKVKKENYSGSYDAIDIVYEDNKDSVMSGSTSVYKLKATGYLMLASQTDLAKVFSSGIRGYNGESTRISYADSIKYTKKDTDQIANLDKLSILVEGSPRIIWNTNYDNLKELVKGKERGDFKSVMSTVTSIKGAEIEFSPLWLSAFPEDVNKINIVESIPKR